MPLAGIRSLADGFRPSVIPMMEAIRWNSCLFVLRDAQEEDLEHICILPYGMIDQSLERRLRAGEP